MPRVIFLTRLHGRRILPAMKTHLENPFEPGQGLMPPYLAGREAEKDVLLELLAKVRPGQRRGAPADAVLSGPRGNGKTVLLRWLEQTAEQRGIDTIWLTPDDIPDLDRLANVLAPPGALQRLGRKLRGVGLFSLKAELDTTPVPKERLDEALIKRCRQAPLVLLLDEAHTLDTEVGRTLLNTSQKVRRKAPFLLALAGTPNLPDHLNKMDASFWPRAEQLGIGRLSPAATAEALTVPLDQAGVRVELPALNTVVDDTQCYPYFIQLWGSALWRQAQQTAAALDEAQLAAARPEVEYRQNNYYEGRRGELKRQQLLPVAVAVAIAFTNHEMLREQTLDDVIAAALPGADWQQVEETRCALQHLGYIWKPPGAEDNWSPGIPSLMTYVHAHEESSQ